jgi:hypothetical protein
LADFAEIEVREENEMAEQSLRAHGKKTGEEIE